MKITFLLFAHIFITSLNGCKSEQLEENINYPTTIFALSTEEYQDALDRYVVLNENKICTSLDRYGFCIDDQVFCPLSTTPITDQNMVISMAKAFINKNIEFTGVTDTNSLTIEFSNEYSICIKCDGSPGDIQTLQWRYSFSNQHYEGYEVLHTTLDARVNNDGVIRFGGHWYPHIEFPSHYNYSFKQVRQSLVGDTITFECLIPRILVLKEANIVETTKKVIIPVEKDDSRIELRVAWEISVMEYNTVDYIFHIDAMTGEIIDQYQNFICD